MCAEVKRLGSRHLTGFQATLGMQEPCAAAEDNRFRTCSHIRTVDLISSELGEAIGSTLIERLAPEKNQRTDVKLCFTSFDKRFDAEFLARIASKRVSGFSVKEDHAKR